MLLVAKLQCFYLDSFGLAALVLISAVLTEGWRTHIVGSSAIEYANSRSTYYHLKSKSYNGLSNVLHNEEAIVAAMVTNALVSSALCPPALSLYSLFIWPC